MMDYDALDFEILECSLPDAFGFVDSDRVLELMDLGLLKPKDRSTWSEDGYEATIKGRTQFFAWLGQAREKHGHVWVKNDRGDPDPSAYSEGFHSGFKCENCGFEFCSICYQEMDLEPCGASTRGVRMRDDEKLDKNMVAFDAAMRRR